MLLPVGSVTCPRSTQDSPGPTRIEQRRRPARRPRAHGWRAAASSVLHLNTICVHDDLVLFARGGRKGGLVLCPAVLDEYFDQTELAAGNFLENRGFRRG